MLTLLSFRSEETAAKPFLQALIERAGRGIWSAISLEPMTEDEAHTLIGILLPVNSTVTRSNFVWLAADDPDEGEREAVQSIERWSQKGFHRQHYSAMLARVQTALYRGNGDAAWRLLDEQQSMLRRSLLTRVQFSPTQSARRAP